MNTGMAHGNIDHGGTVSVRIGAGYHMKWSATTHASSHATFLPWLQVTLLFKQEHV